MDGLLFRTAATPVRSDPARADIACFVGFVACRPHAPAGDRRSVVPLRRTRLQRALRDAGWHGPDLPGDDRLVPPAVLPYGDTPSSFPRWLEGLGWVSGPGATAPAELFHAVATELLSASLVDWWVDQAWLTPSSGRNAADLLELNDVPVPIDTWDAFDALFAWDQRPGPARSLFDTTLGAAVRRFFLQGGRKCYVVRVGDPWAVVARQDEREPNRSRILPAAPPPTPVDRRSWRGVGHLFGLPDVSFLCAPDLPELFAADLPQPDPQAPPVIVEERFVECATPITHRDDRRVPLVTAPCSTRAGFEEWTACVCRIGGLLKNHRREVQFVAAVPLAAPEEQGTGAPWNHAGSIQTAFVQLGYPWLRTRESRLLPGSVEPPDGMLAGMLAGNALIAGTWRSLAREAVFGVTGLAPVLSRSELERALPYHGAGAQARTQRTRYERVSMFAPTPTGFQLLSDVTTDDDEAYRPANVNRLVGAIIRAAGIIGETTVFENNGEALWRRLRSGLEVMLLGLWSDGALAGATAAEACDVRCDRSTMTQSDLDAGRVVIRVQFSAARPIDQIVLVLAMDEGGQVSLVPAPREDTAGVPA